MPFRKRGSPHLYTWPVVAGYGRVGPWSTGTRDRARAAAMEAMLKELPLRGRGDVLRMLVDGQTNLRDVYVHHLEGRLDQLVATATDPKLDELARNQSCNH